MKLDRFVKFRSKIPSEELWNSLSENGRAGIIRTLLDEDSANHDWDNFVYDVYVKAHDMLIKTQPYMDHKFGYFKLLELLDLCEKIAKNWVFV